MKRKQVGHLWTDEKQEWIMEVDKSIDLDAMHLIKILLDMQAMGKININVDAVVGCSYLL